MAKRELELGHVTSRFMKLESDYKTIQDKLTEVSREVVEVKSRVVSVAHLSPFE